MALSINGTTGISGVDGSVSAPAVTGTDSNTGITFPSADTIKFATGGVERMSITNSGVSGIAAGITMADQWRLNAAVNVSGNSDTILSSNWERVDTGGFGQLGTGMTESSGVFTFPSTGIYQIIFHAETYSGSGSNPRNMSRIYTTTDGSSFGFAANSNSHQQSGGYYASSDTFFQFDVTNTSTHKCYFLSYIQGSNTVGYLSDTSTSKTSASFIRLGDT